MLEKVRLNIVPNRLIIFADLIFVMILIFLHYTLDRVLINHMDIEKYRMAVKMWLNNGVRIKNSDFPDEIRTINNTTSFLDRFKVVDLNGKCHTVVAHISKDGHYYIYPSTNTIRSISVREAARIQSFPDDFFFEGSRSSVFKQIGNAVPPLMAYAIAKAILKSLCPKTI